MSKPVEKQLERTFPWKCHQCRQKKVEPNQFVYTTEIIHDGHTYTVTVPDLEAPRCSHCGAVVLTDEANRRISDVFRGEARLLTPEEIRKNRESCGISQQELASHLGIPEVALFRWESGWQFQTRAMDRLLRLYFDLPSARQKLRQLAEPEFAQENTTSPQPGVLQYPIREEEFRADANKDGGM
jgi:putative zinc finger/helix-turn-helix YgiT family protein